MSRQNGSISLVVILLLSIGVMTSGYFLYDSYDQRDTLTTTLDKTKKKLRRTEQRLREKESSLSDQESELYSLNTQSTQLKKEIETVKQQLTQAQHSQQQAEQSLSQATNELQSQLLDRETAYEKELAELNTASSELNQKYQTAQQALDNERTRTEEFTTAISQLEQDVNDKQAALEQSKQQLEQERSRSQTYTSTIATLESNINEGQEALDLAQQELDAERSRSEAYTVKIEKLKQRLSGEQDALAELKEKLNQLGQANKQLSSNNEQLHSEKNRLVKQFKDGTTIIRLEDSVLFPQGSAELNAKGRDILAAVANTLNFFPNHRISIEGHTDNKPITSALNKKYPSNWELSSARASGAIRFLTKQGLPSKQFQAVGLANTQPIGKTNDALGRQKDRRIEILLYPPTEKLTIEVYKSSVANKLSSN